MNSNKVGNPGKIVNIFVSTVGTVWGKKIVKFYWYSYMDAETKRWTLKQNHVLEKWVSFQKSSIW